MWRRTQSGAFTRGLVIGAGALALVIVVAANWGVVHQVAAQAVTPFSIEDVGGSVGLPSRDLKTVLINILKWVLGILALVAVAFIIYGGIIWMTAQGDQQKILKAKKIIASALIGLIIVLMSWAIVVFVVGTAGNVTNTSTGGPGGPGTPPLPTTSFEIRSITTGCGTPPNYREDVFLCSGVSITFNHEVAANTVEAALGWTRPPPPIVAHDDQLIIEKCDNTSTDTVCNGPTDAAPAIMNQVYAPAYTGTQPEWVVPSAGKSIVFYHKHEFFEPNTFYRIRIPKAIRDRANKPIEHCRKNTFGTPIDGEGCNDQGNYFDWIFQTGVTVDTDPPDITTTYPDTRYRQNSAVYHPDRNVNRVPIITVQLDEAIDPNSIDQTNVAAGTWRNNTVVIEEYTAPPDVNDGSVGTLDPTPLDPAKFTVVPNGDNTGLEIQLKPGADPAQPNLLKEFTWYKVTVQHLRDLCQNLQAIDPYTIVFETNNVAPGVASVYPANDYQFSCPDTDVSISYTVSMYDSLNSSCAAAPVVGGFITEGILKDEHGAAVAGRGFNVPPEFDYRGAPANPNDFCKVYAFRPTTASLDVNLRFDVGVNSRYMLTETDSLNFGDLANPPRAGLVSDPAAIDWHFNVKPPGQCANAPQILDIRPASGPVGQCFSIIGNYFGAGTNANDAAKMGAQTLTVPAGAWSDQNIVSTAPDDPVTVPPGNPWNEYDMSVAVEHPAPFGVLTTVAPPNLRFKLTDAAASRGPCLFSLNPSSGPWGTLVDLAGIRFRPQNATSTVRFVGSPTGAMPFQGWSDAFIRGATILDNSNSGLVTVETGGQPSNPLLLVTYPPAPGQPRVTNVWPGCDAACVNASIGARFDQDLDPTTVRFAAPAASVELWQCPDQNCPIPTAKLAITAGSPPPGPNDTVMLLTHDALVSDAWYRVVLYGGPSGIKGAAGGELFPGGLDFDTDTVTPGNDSRAWVFKTKNDPTECRLASVNVQPPGPTTLRINWTLDMEALAYGTPDSCHPGGQLLNGHDYAWAWTSTDTATVDITNALSPVSGQVSPSQQALAQAVTTGETIQAQTVQTYGTFQDTAVVAVSPDPTFCNASSECRVNEIGQSCSSECVSNRCTPVVNAVDSGRIPPESGHEGDWVTVRGCWFGNYQAGVSKVMFSANEEGGVPNPAQCGDSWRNFEVIRVVPALAIDGPMSLIRDDGHLDRTNTPTVPAVPSAPTTGDTAVPDFQKLPGPSTSPHLCRLDPNHGLGGSADTLYGDNFQAYTAGTDKATYTLNQDATIGTWANQQIDVTVPATVADGDVVVKKGVETSNPVWYDVDGSGPGGPPGGCNACVVDANCAVGGCGSNGCCAPKPVISTNQPQGVNVCRNSVISATFTGAPINPSTVNNVSVKLLNAGVPVPVTYQADDNGFWLYPSVLAPSTLYDVEVNALVKSRAGVAAVPLTWSFTTGSEVCQLDRLTIDPALHTFTQRGNTQGFTAHAFAQNGMEISPVLGVYDWTWSWALVQAGPVTISSSNTNTETAIAQQDGQTLLQVTATSGAGWSGTRSAVADIRVMLCDNPWSLADLATGTYHDTQGYGCGGGGGVTTFLGGACQDYNISTTYCRGQNGAPLLPDLNVGLVRGVTGDRLKEFIFKSSSGEARDAIGLLIFRNSEGLSPQAWLEQNQPGESTGGQSTTIQGYPAYRLGTTTYVASTNLNSTAESCSIMSLGNASFENPESCVPPGVDWNCNPTRPPVQDTAAPNSGAFSATLTGTTGQAWMTQDIETASPAARTYRIEAWVKVKKQNPAATGGAGFITQCYNNDAEHSTNHTDCDEDVSTSFDLYGGAPGASGNLGTNSGWRHFGPFTVSNFTGIDLGLRLNCFADPGWQVWCDNIVVKKVDSNCTSGTLDQNIYLLSYTEGASGETLATVDQMLRNWELNINPVLTAQDRVAIARDTQRLGDITTIKKAINGYVARGGVLPALEGGTFTPHLSTSKWSSWNATLGNAIGTGLPVDPLNNFDPVCSAAGPYQPEAETCWSQQNHQFSCPANSHVYGYLYTPGNCTATGTTCRTDGECAGGNTCTNPPPSYTVGTNLEYAGPASLRGSLTDLCTDAATDPSECRCFTKTVSGP